LDLPFALRLLYQVCSTIIAKHSQLNGQLVFVI
jgi:hypothetical protein